MARKRARKAYQRRPLLERQAEANQQLEAVLAETADAENIFSLHAHYLLGYVWSRVPARIRKGACDGLRKKAEQARAGRAAA